jgi:prepilin-type N-terminal cleavage/methylation domain-containing protein
MDVSKMYLFGIYSFYGNRRGLGYSYCFGAFHLLMGAMPCRFLRTTRNRGVTLVECVVAMAVVGIGLGGLMAINSHQLQLVRSSHDSNTATMCISERVEQMRIAHWKQLIDPNYLRAKFYAMAPKAGGSLANLRERVTVTAYPNASVATPLVVERASNQTPVIVCPGSGLADQKTVRVDVYLAYNGMGGRERNRQASMLLSNGGINRSTLPSFGSTASGTTDGPTGGGSVVVSGPGDGRGNVAGESGKK